MTDRSPVALGQVLKWGGLGGLTAVFISAIGMVEVFDSRKVIDPVLSLAYLLLMVIPLWIGYRVSKRTVLEGSRTDSAEHARLGRRGSDRRYRRRWPRAFILLIDTVNLAAYWSMSSRPPGPPHVRTGICHGGPDRPRSRRRTRRRRRNNAPRARPRAPLLCAPSCGCSSSGSSKLLLGSVLREVGLVAVDGFIFNSARRMPWYAAITIAVLVIVLSVVFRGRSQTLRRASPHCPRPAERRVGFIAALAAILFAMTVPANAGPLLNEVLATVGLFALMGLGLNIVVGYAGLLDLGYVAFCGRGVLDGDPGLGIVAELHTRSLPSLQRFRS